MEAMKMRLMGAARRLAGWWKKRLDGLKALLADREARARLGYYAGLAVLLAMLGLGAHAWRVRGQPGDDAPVQPPREVMAMRVPTLAPVPMATPEPVRWTWPLEGEILADYSPQAPVWSETLGQWQTHPALDIAGSPGEAVYACRDGAVSEVWSDRLWGNVVVIDHDGGYRSTYAGLNTLEMVREGDAVAAGQVIGSVGQSASCEAERGWHIHFELTKDGEPEDFAALVE